MDIPLLSPLAWQHCDWNTNIESSSSTGRASIEKHRMYIIYDIAWICLCLAIIRPLNGFSSLEGDWLFAARTVVRPSSSSRHTWMASYHGLWLTATMWKQHSTTPLRCTTGLSLVSVVENPLKPRKSEIIHNTLNAMCDAIHWKWIHMYSPRRVETIRYTVVAKLKCESNKSHCLEPISDYYMRKIYVCAERPCISASNWQWIICGALEVCSGLVCGFCYRATRFSILFHFA